MAYSECTCTYLRHLLPLTYLQKVQETHSCSHVPNGNVAASKIADDLMFLIFKIP